jgi:hypothetical protein
LNLFWFRSTTLSLAGAAQSPHQSLQQSRLYSCRPLYFGHAAAEGLRIRDGDEAVAPASKIKFPAAFPWSNGVAESEIKLIKNGVFI